MSTILADFTHIFGSDGPVPGAPGVSSVAMQEDFNTGGIRGERAAILMFSIMPVANPPAPAQGDVYINNHMVGEILVAAHGTFTTQTIAIPVASQVDFKATNGQDNVFAIKNVPRSFAIKNIVCFFHQES